MARPAPSASADASLVRQHARLLAMTDARRADTVLVDELLASSHGSVRAATVLAVGQNRVAARAARLRALLADADTAVAAGAAFGLGLMRDTGSVAALRATLVDAAARPGVALEAAWALGEIGAPARAAVEEALGTVRVPAVLEQLLHSASRLRPVPVGRITPHLAPDGPVAAAAAYALARTRAPAGVRPLLPLAAARSAAVRAQVARALARPGAGDSLAADARAGLAVLAMDSSAHVRVNAVRSLASYGEASRDRLLAATRDPDPNVRVAASELLDQALASEPAPWLDAWAADTGLTFRANVLAAAMRRGVRLPVLRAGVDAWTDARDWRLRAAAASAAGQASSSDVAAEVALPATRDADGRVRTAAWRALSRWTDSSAAPGPSWRAAMVSRGLYDADPVVRAAVLGALAPRARARDVPAILDAYARAAGDSANDARLAALAALRSAWQADSLDFSSELRARLRALPAPADPLERAAGRRIAPLADWPDAAGAPRGLAWYEAVVRDVLVPSLSGQEPRAVVATDRGPITVVLHGADAPLTVANFLALSRAGFYRDGRFHRVVPNFVAQDGDPRGDGEGGPGYAIRDELNRRRYDRGALGMALSGPDTGGSQWFLTHSAQPHLDGHYTVFGRIVAGWGALDRIVQGDRIADVRAP